MQKSFNTFVQPFMSYVTCHVHMYMLLYLYVLHFSFKTPVFKFTCFDFKIPTGNFSTHNKRRFVYQFFLLHSGLLK